MQPQTYTSSLPFMVGWIDPNGGNDPAGGGELLSAMPAFEKLLFQKCPNITNTGLSKLIQLPNLKTLDLQKCENLTPIGLEGFRSDVQINYQPAA